MSRARERRETRVETQLSRPACPTRPIGPTRPIPGPPTPTTHHPTPSSGEPRIPRIGANQERRTSRRHRREEGLHHGLHGWARMETRPTAKHAKNAKRARTTETRGPPSRRGTAAALFTAKTDHRQPNTPLPACPRNPLDIPPRLWRNGVHKGSTPGGKPCSPFGLPATRSAQNQCRVRLRAYPLRRALVRLRRIRKLHPASTNDR